MANYSNDPLTPEEDARRRELMNTVGGVGNLRDGLPPKTQRREMAFRERLLDEQELTATREGATSTRRPSSIGGIVSFEPLDPSIIQFDPVDLREVQNEAEALTFQALQNVTNRVPEIVDFARSFNEASADEFENVLDFVLPGNQRQIREDISNLAANLLRGELPSDVSRRIFLQAAATSLQTGQPVTSPFIRQIQTADLAQGFLGGVNLAQNLIGFSRQNFTPPFIDPGRLGLETFANLSVPVTTALQNAQFNTQGEYNALLNRFNVEANNRMALLSEEQARLDRERGLREARTASRTNTWQLVGMAAGALIGGGLGQSAAAASLGASLGGAAGGAIGASQAATPAQQAGSIGFASQSLVTGLNIAGQMQAQNQQQAFQQQLISALSGGGGAGSASVYSPVSLPPNSFNSPVPASAPAATQATPLGLPPAQLQQSIGATP